MKNSRPVPRLRLVAAGCGGAVQVGSNRLVIRLPDPRVIRLAVRLTLIAIAIAVLTFPWLSSVVLRSGDAPVAVPESSLRQQASQGFGRLLPTLVRDLRRRGLLRKKDKVVFHHDAISARPASQVPDGSADFVFSTIGSGSRGFDEIDRILTINGVAAIRLSSEPSESFVPPANYRMTYIRRMGAATVVAVRKFAPSIGAWSSRRLLSVQKTKKEALDELEDVLLEPPAATKRTSWRRSRKTKFLPELTGDSLDEYPRRLFVEVVPAGRAPDAGGNAAEWFERYYPKNRAFEFVQLVEVAAKDADQSGSLLPSSTSSPSTSSSSSSSSSSSEEAAEMGISEWLEQNVREEEYVVVKAEAEAVEEMVSKGSVRLVDELFLECEHQWGVKTRSRRPYWQCLELYGKLLDQGVAVHQWWGSS